MNKVDGNVCVLKSADGEINFVKSEKIAGASLKALSSAISKN